MTGLKDFQRFFRDFIGLITAGVATAALVLVTALVGLAPPWPPALVQVTAIGQIAVLILIYQLLKNASKSRINRGLFKSLSVAILFAIIYLALHSLLIFEMPNEDLGLRGFACTSDARSLYEESCPFLNSHQIADAEFDAGQLWTPVSLMFARISMVSLWIGFFSCLVAFFGIFVIYQRRR